MTRLRLLHWRTAAAPTAWQRAAQTAFAVSLTLLLVAGGSALGIAAVCVGLAPIIGVAWALGLLGLVLLILAGITLILWRILRITAMPPEPVPDFRPDPLLQLVFDISFNLGRSLTRRKD